MQGRLGNVGFAAAAAAAASFFFNNWAHCCPTVFSIEEERNGYSVLISNLNHVYK